MNLHATSGPAIERPGDLAAILTNLEERDVLFIDEIHRLNHSVEEILYPAMEDFAIDVMIGRGPSARSLRLSLKPFTVVGATTRAGRVGGPLRDRFGAVYRLDYYSQEELATIIRRSAGILDVDIEPAAVDVLARRGRGTPRVVNRLLRRVRDYAQIRSDGRIGAQEATDAMNAMDIDDEGLDTTDRRLLAAIVQKFASGPVGGAAVAAVIGEEVDTIEDVYEPYLLQLGFLDRTPQGRVATERARDHLRALGYEVPPPRRSERTDAGLWDGMTAEGRGRVGDEASRAGRVGSARLTQTPIELAVATRGLVKSYGKHTALVGLDMSVPRGQVYGFLGPNGSGKTTALRLLTGLLRPNAGDIFALRRRSTRGTTASACSASAR